MIAGRYTLEREIGRGGAGIVHLAHDEVLGRSVAIKRIGLLPGTTGHDIARAEREARLAAGINHPHVVSIFDLVKDEDCYWLVMEHVEGRTLAELIAADGPLAYTRAAGIIAQAADALVQANKAGIVHRDVKPSNIMVNDDNHAKLGDFGIARAASDAALTQTGFVTGSPAYLAPEVASGAQATRGERRVVARRHTVPRYRRPSAVRRGRERPGRPLQDRPRRPAAAARRPPGGRAAGHDDGEGPRPAMARDSGARRPAANRARPEQQRGRGAAAGGPPRGRERRTRPRSPRRRPNRWRSRPRRRPRTARRNQTPHEPPPSRPPRPPTASRGLPLGWISAVIALVLLAGLGAWLLWPGDGERTDTTAGTSGTEQTEEPSVTEEPTQEPTQEPTEEPTETEEPTTEPSSGTGGASGRRAAMRAFVQDYFSPGHLRPGVDLRDAHARVPGRERWLSSGTPGSGARSARRPPTTSRRIPARSRRPTPSTSSTLLAGRPRRWSQLQLQPQDDGFLIAGEG